MRYDIGWIVDAQNDFMRKDGKLYVPDAELIIPTVLHVYDWMRENMDLVITTGDFHDLADPEIDEDEPDYKNTFPPHCMAYTDGAALVGHMEDGIAHVVPEWPLRAGYRGAQVARKVLAELRDRGEHVHVDKIKFDVFSGNYNIDGFLKEYTRHAPARIFVCGVATDVCVRFAVEGLIDRGHEVVLIRDAVKGLNITPDKELFTRWQKAGVKFIQSGDLGKEYEA